MRLDHLAVSAVSLDVGIAAVEAALGLTLQGGGKHVAMGTHNRLLGLGDVYLEVIAVDPALPSPARPRWFDLDRFSGPPRLTNWVIASDDLAADLSACPAGIGVPMALSRGDLRWTMAVPEDGVLPFGGAFPAVIAWDSAIHPARLLPDTGARLERLEIAHPKAAALRAALQGLLDDPRVVILDGDAPALQATIATPHGPRVLR